MTKGKSHYRGARTDIMKRNAGNARHKARAKSYDRKAYDGTTSEES